VLEEDLLQPRPLEDQVLDAMAEESPGPGESPNSERLPLVGRSRPSINRMVVVLPAPFGPRKPNVSPARTENEMLSIPRRRPYRLVSSRASMTVALVGAKTTPAL
jgi:hypothetical protein